MKRGHIRYIMQLGLIIGLLLLSVDSYAQGFLSVKVTPRKVVVHQPFRVELTAYSSTWFSKPLKFVDLEVEGAFIVPFTRTVSGVHYINGKKYAGLTFYYMVFPYRVGTIEFPELNVIATIPPEGEYKGVETTLVSKPQKIEVSDLPISIGSDIWMVANRLRLKDRWSTPKDKIYRVGDVITRDIEVTTYGTLPTFIPSISSILDLEEESGVGIYKGESSIKDLRTDNAINGVRKEKFSYLLEKEGTITIPSHTISVYNPYRKRVVNYNLKEKSIEVVENLDMTILSTLKDSLDMVSAVPMGGEESKKSAISVKDILKIVSILLLTLILVYICRVVIRYYKRRRRAYLSSDKYRMDMFYCSARKGNLEEAMRLLYQSKVGKEFGANRSSTWIRDNINILPIVSYVWGYKRGESKYSAKGALKRELKALRNQNDR